MDVMRFCQQLYSSSVLSFLMLQRLEVLSRTDADYVINDNDWGCFVSGVAVACDDEDDDTNKQVRVAKF